MTDNASDLFAVELTDVQLDVRRMGIRTERRVVSIMKLLEQDLADQIQRFDLENITSASRRRRRTEALIRSIREILDRRYDRAALRLRNEMRELSIFSHSATVEAINTVFTVDISRVTITHADLRALADDAVVMGAPAKEHWAAQKASTRNRFAQEMRIGQAQGETNEQLVQRIRGRATGRTIGIEMPNGKTRRVREFAGGIMDTTTHKATSLVRTSSNSVSNNAIMQTYEENQDILRGYEALTTLDGRTSDILYVQDRRCVGSGWERPTRVVRQRVVPRASPLAFSVPD